MSNPLFFQKLHTDVTDALGGVQKAIGAMPVDMLPDDLKTLDEAITTYLNTPHPAPEAEPAPQEPAPAGTEA